MARGIPEHVRQQEKTLGITHLKPDMAQMREEQSLPIARLRPSESALYPLEFHVLQGPEKGQVIKGRSAMSISEACARQQIDVSRDFEIRVGKNKKRSTVRAEISSDAFAHFMALTALQIDDFWRFVESRISPAFQAVLATLPAPQQIIPATERTMMGLLQQWQKQREMRVRSLTQPTIPHRPATIGDWRYTAYKGYLRMMTMAERGSGASRVLRPVSDPAEHLADGFGTAINLFVQLFTTCLDDCQKRGIAMNTALAKRIMNTIRSVVPYFVFMHLSMIVKIQNHDPSVRTLVRFEGDAANTYKVIFDHTAFQKYLELFPKNPLLRRGFTGCPAYMTENNVVTAFTKLLGDLILASYTGGRQR